MTANPGQRSFEIPDANMLGTLKYITVHCPLRPGPIMRRSNASTAGGRSTVSPSSRPGERRKRKMPRHPAPPPFVTFRKTSPDKPILDQERTGSESGHRAKQPWPVPAQNPPSPVVSAPHIGQAHRLSAIPRPETVCQPATQHFRQKETDKREQAAEQTDESPIACGRDTKARPRRCRQHVLVPTAEPAGNPRETTANTHTENRLTNRKIRHAHGRRSALAPTTRPAGAESHRQQIAEQP